MGRRIPCAAVVDRMGMGHALKANNHMTEKKGSAHDERSSKDPIRYNDLDARLIN